ncbi:hypothetical protein BT93_B0849 [Corymbia citriodora subsp. variegata]|nr:hypothetical protein BT93_B0849 [Corymbia citriodora subsp. variegata]
MAEAVVISIAEDIVGYLVPRALDYVGKFYGVKCEIEVLKERVLTLQYLLDDAEEKYYQNQNPQNRQIRVWLQNVKDAFYEAQDVLEEFDIETIRRDLRGRYGMCKKVRTFFSSSNQLVYKLKMTYQIRAVSVRIEAIKTDRTFHLDERPKREWMNREETHSFIRGEDIIGRDGDKKKVMDFLLDSNFGENVSILPIVGIGGLGKTALAQYVYGESKFDLKMWVCVSTDFDVKKIVKKMLACAKDKEPTEDTMELLQSKLRKEIDGKKYLLVLDDVWDSHFLGGLSDSASLKLLMQMAGRKIEEQDSNMLAIGKEIVRKCVGVPLVVRTIGYLLSSKETKREWLRFKEDELPEVSKSGENILSVLRLSYNHLPPHLKQCFALCSLFPKDYEIKKETLIDLWMANGFIQSSNGKHLEDVAHKYFMDLLWSNFFQDYKKDILNKDTCKMHDLMHDLARLVAGKECWVAGDDTESVNESIRHISYGSTFNLMGELPISRLKASALRTILSTTHLKESGQSQPTSEADLQKLIQNFKRLRVLGLCGTKVEKVPGSICELKHLTYLDLSCNFRLKRLPNSITRLQSLQTLNLDQCSALEELPSDIKKLVSLRNLNIDRCSIRYMPHGLGELSSLHRLTHFILPKDKAGAKNYCGLGELNRLNNIRGRLKIEYLGYVTDVETESKDANLEGKHSLESLVLRWRWSGFRTDNAVIGNRDEALLDGLRPHSNLQKLFISQYQGESFPRWMMDSLISFLPNLIEVCFNECGRCKCLPPLGQLPNLEILDIESLPKLEYIESGRSSTSTTSFPKLSRLRFFRCEKLKAMPLAPHLEELHLYDANVQLSINQMRDLKKLKSLHIQEMKFLECLPEECFQSLTSLESLQIMGCNRLTSLSQGLRHLTSLVNLSIGYCEELDISKDERGNLLDFHGLPSLRSIEDLRSLQRLEIEGCDSLTSLPEGMRRLTSLTDLEIMDCPELKERCERDIGEDWDKIKHIPNIRIPW